MKYSLFLLFFAVSGIPLSAQWQRIPFQDGGGIYAASSELEKPASMMDFGRYSPHNLFDHDSATAWVEGEKGPGIGSYILIGIRHGVKKYILLYNGYQQSESLFYKNNRVKELKLSLHIGFILPEEDGGQFGLQADTVPFGKDAFLSVKDAMGVQRFKLPFDLTKIHTFRKTERNRYLKAHPGNNKVQDFIFIKFEILSVYKGNRWDDTCIAGIEFTDSPTGLYIPVDEKITGIYPNDEADKIFIRTSSQRELVLADAGFLAERFSYTGEGEFLTLSLMDISPDKEWAIIDYQHGFSSGGRIEETSHLWSVRRMEEVPPSLLRRYQIDSPLNFKLKNNHLYLETEGEKNILLEDIDTDLDNLMQ